MDKLKGFDKKLILNISILFLIGEILIASATHVKYGGSPKRLIIQLIAFILGLFLVYFFKFVDYRDFRKYKIRIYILSMVSLLLVYIPGLGATLGGARGWINLKIMYFQPIEIAKLGFIIFFADYLEKHYMKFHSLKEIIKALIIPMPIILLLLKQPDLGGALVFFSIILGMLFFAGLSIPLMKKTFALLILLSPIIYLYVLDKILLPYQMNRIFVFLDVSSSYQVYQSIIAIASGGLFGKGPFQGTQNTLGFLSVSDSDFIFAVLGEEYGAVGMIIFIILYFKFLTRLLKIANTADDIFGSLIVVGIFSLFLYQFIQNVGMTLGLMPVTGVTLPFVSYGGSSMLMSMLAIAICENVAAKRKRLNFR